MATITERFGFTKPAGNDPASIVPLNSNTDLIEQYLGRTQDMIAPLYDDTATYDVGDIVTYESNLYKCITAISTAETFDPTKWEATTAVEEGSGGGGGSSVIPNPTGTPTDTLSTVSIDGTIFGIKGGFYIKQLSVTENGTYSEEGTAYRPVIVNVPAPPIPDNAYLLNEVEGLPSDIATFADGSALPMPSLKVGIEPVQEGSGDPSPENVRHISGHTEANVVVSPTTDAEDGTTYNIQFKDRDNPLTVYGGSLDVVSGELTVDRVSTNLSASWYWFVGSTQPSGKTVISTSSFPEHKGNIATCSHYKQGNTIYVVDMNYGEFIVSDGGVGAYFCFKNETGGTVQEFKDIITAQENAGTPIQICYELATPITYQLTPTQVKSLLGTNNVWADTGDIIELEYFSKEA